MPAKKNHHSGKSMQKISHSLPNVALLIRKNSKQELSITVRHVSLWHNNILSRRKGEECHDFTSHTVVCNIERLLQKSITVGSQLLFVV